MWGGGEGAGGRRGRERVREREWGGERVREREGGGRVKEGELESRENLITVSIVHWHK